MYLEHDTCLGNTMNYEYQSLKISKNGYEMVSRLKPSLSMKILSINDFTIKLLINNLSDLCSGVHLKSSL